MFAYPCPFCQQRLLASPERVGQRTICPKCMKPIVIPRAEGVHAEEGRITVPELIGDSPSTIFVDDFHTDDDGADGMDLSLPDDQDEFGGFVNDSGQLLPALEAAVPYAVAAPVAANEPAFTPAVMAMAAASVAPAASPHLGGLGAGPAAFQPVNDYASTSTPTPMPRDNGVVVFHPTVHESADLAAELTTALTMRMKPPPEPPSDLRLSTGAWLALTALGICLWMLSMMRLNDDPARQLLQAAGAIGALEIVISYVWVAYLSGRRNTQRGFQALLPPVWLYRLGYPCENTPGYRPLRFAVAGTLLVILAILGGELRPAVQRVTGDPDIQTIYVPKRENTPLSRLKEAESEGINHLITESLAELSKDPAAFHATAEEKQQLIAELRTLRTHESGEVRGAALIALKKWSGLDAVKPEVLAVLRNRSAEPHERRAALDVAREYKDRDVARAVAQCIGYRGPYQDVDSRAKDTLRAIGPPEAEEVLLELFEDEDLLLRGLPGLLAEIGGPKSIVQLRKIAATSQSKDVRDEATRTADKIAARLGIKSE